MRFRKIVYIVKLTMAAKKIIVFLGSTRDGRQGEKVARFVGSVLEKSGVTAKIFGNNIPFH